MRAGEEAEVCALVERVFNEFVAPDYGAQGVEVLFQFAHPAAMAERAGPGQVVIVAEQGADLVGMIEMRQCEHIAMLFVSQRGQGIGKELIKRAVEKCRKRKPDLKTITVNSSPFAEPIYAKMGFQATGPLQTKNGITFRPMACDLRQ